MIGRRWAADIHHAMQERVWDPLLGRRRCPLLAPFLSGPSAPNVSDHAATHEGLDQVFRIVVGRRLSRSVVGTRHPRRHSLTDFLQRGFSDAERILPYVRPHESVFEYGGGVGRIGRAVAPHVDQLVSVDINPLMKAYGPRLAPRVDFRNLDELPELPAFDGAYSIAVFFHLTLAQQKNALAYVHRRLKPGGWFLVDLKIGPRTTGNQMKYGNLGYTALDDFRPLYEPLFTATPVPLCYSGFFMQKR
jgi:SAM-dependent methyltransferase